MVKNRLVANVEAKKKMEKGPPERQRRLLSRFWTFSLSMTFPEITSLQSYSLTSLEGEEEEERKRWREIRLLDFLCFHDFSRNPVFAILRGEGAGLWNHWNGLQLLPVALSRTLRASTWSRTV
jgi:hypothetical protein